MTSCGDFEDGASGRLAPAREVLRDEMRAGGGGEMAAGEADTLRLALTARRPGRGMSVVRAEAPGSASARNNLAVWRSISDAVARAFACRALIAPLPKVCIARAAVARLQGC